VPVLKLEGDLTIAAVIGEIEKTQWSDEFVGKEFRGYGVGTHHPVNHGVLPDMCILGEPTDMQLVLGITELCGYGSRRGDTMSHGFYAREAGSTALFFRMKQILDPIYTTGFRRGSAKLLTMASLGW